MAFERSRIVCYRLCVVFACSVFSLVKHLIPVANWSFLNSSSISTFWPLVLSFSRIVYSLVDSLSREIFINLS